MILNHNFDTKIRQNFTKRVELYEKTAFVQREAAEILVNLLCDYDPSFEPSTILELGAGTGYIAEYLLAKRSNSIYILNDLSKQMLAVAKSKFGNYHNVHYSLGDMEIMEFGRYDLIISNFALQWAKNLQRIISRSHSSSNIFAFSTLLDGSFLEWWNLCSEFGMKKPPVNYPSFNELELYCKSLKPKKHLILTKEFEIRFDSVALFIKYLKNLDANISSIDNSVSIVRKMIKRNNGEFITRYKVFFAIIS